VTFSQIIQAEIDEETARIESSGEVSLDRLQYLAALRSALPQAAGGGGGGGGGIVTGTGGVELARQTTLLAANGLLTTIRDNSDQVESALNSLNLSTDQVETLLSSLQAATNSVTTAVNSAETASNADRDAINTSVLAVQTATAQVQTAVDAVTAAVNAAEATSNADRDAANALLTTIRDNADQVETRLDAVNTTLTASETAANLDRDLLQTAIGLPGDPVATSDTGVFGVIALLKRLLSQKFSAPATSLFKNPALGATPVLAGAGARSVYGWRFVNLGASPVFVKLYDAATAAAVTVGTTPPVGLIQVPAGGYEAQPVTSSTQFAFAAGCVIAAVSGTEDSSSASGGAIYCEVRYA
jgi:hypothetical protein